ncbi:hypothetical protein BFJ69_g15146 [Fusarium oxysporum]|uniref:Nephrocystin 3-like N-terminal domain-containing protein n=1 Tax=Fusarium oxysporum TaxID=5507 RepID=A0A420MF57_FUSOX|nr:hypothetical protein BFJ69_g15146 [Fusarium oxysporum]
MASSKTPIGYQFVNDRTNVMAQGPVTNSTFHMHLASNSLGPEDCRRDLFLTDPTEDKNALKRKKGNRAAGTCEWILGTEELVAWLDTGQGLTPESPATDILWLYGNPGTGKSIMSIFLAEELSNRFSATDGKTLSYFFCDSNFDKRKTATSVIRGLLWQLVQQHPPLLEYVLPKYAERGPELFKSFDALWAMFMDIAADRTSGRKYCIIDALDECDRESQDILLRELWQSFSPSNSSNRVSNIRILITSRPYPEIAEYLEEFANRNLISFRESQRDIERFIDEKVANLRKRKHYSNQVTNQVTTALKDKAEGTFLWVGLACEELDVVASKDAANYLQALPKGLHLLYNRLLDTALKPEGERDTIRCILSFVVASLRPLSLSELSVACQLHEEEDEETRIQFTRDEVASCRLMVIIQDDKVLLLHQSVKDFLVGPGADRFINVLEAHASFAHRCVDQLIRWFKQEPDMAPDDSFRSYSAQFWANHAHMAHSKFTIKTSEATFFKIHSECREHWLAIYRSRFNDRIAYQFSIFHVAGHWGIHGLVEFALEPQNYRASTPDYVDTNYVDSDGVSPLEEAARSGYKEVITSLLSREKPGSIVRPQIQIAAARNEKNGTEVMALLFDQRGDQISITEEVVKAAIQNWANGVELIKLLLERRGDQVIVTEEVVKAAAQNWMNGTELMILFLDWVGVQIRITEGLLMAIADSFDEQVMARLLNRWGDDITITAEVIKAASGNEQNGKEVMALLLGRRGDQVTITEDVIKVAAGNEDNGKEVLALLLDLRGNQITITEDVIRVAAGNEDNGKEVIALMLHRGGRQIRITTKAVEMIAQRLDERIMALLLDQRGDQIAITEGVVRAAASNKKNGKEVLALLLDRRGNQITITERLVEAIAINKKNGNEVIALLVDRRGDKTTITEDGLMAAVGKGHVEVVKLLLDKGADVNIPDKDGWTPVFSASWNGYVEVVKLLLDKGADVNIPDKNGWTPVSAASANGHVEVVKLLLDKGADVNIPDKNGWTPVSAASANRHVEVVKLLLDKGADVNIPTKDGRTPVSAASANGHAEVVKLLLDKGADVNIPTKDGRTPVYAASANGHVEVVKILLGILCVDANKPDCLGRTALFLASRYGQYQAVHVLLSEGRVNSDNRDWMGSTPLFAAVANGHLDVVKLLIARVATVEGQGGVGWSLIWWARRSGDPRVLQLLMQHAEMVGSRVPDDPTPNDAVSTPFDKEAAWCDASSAPAHGSSLGNLLTRRIGEPEKRACTIFLSTIRNILSCVVMITQYLSTAKPPGEVAKKQNADFSDKISTVISRISDAWSAAAAASDHVTFEELRKTVDSERFEWRDGYADGEASAHERRFPIAYFAGPEFPESSAVEWIAAGDLRILDESSFQSSIPHYHVVRAFLEKRTEHRAVRTEYELEGHQLSAHVDRVLEQRPRLRQKYSRPPPESDRLYRPDVVHPDSSHGCIDVCSTDPAYLVHRTRRGEQEDDPAIHYGLIASANQLMKDALARDKLAASMDVLCFEMEAAGLMNHFPCLVIRGICDYSDSHKNKEWQGFAAMMAAAYAKDLLRQIPPSKVEAEKPISEVLSSIESTGNETKHAVMSMASDHRFAKIEGWLSPPDYSTNANLARKRRHPGTGAWLLNSPAFQDWKLGSRQHLWLYGLAGCGKTILSTTILDHLMQIDTHTTLAFFFDFNDARKQKLEDLLRSLVVQLYHTGNKAVKRLDNLFTSHDNGQRQPDTNALSACVDTMIQTAGKVFIIIDALDECTAREELLQWLKHVASRKAQLIVTSRPEVEFQSAIPRSFSKRNCVQLDKNVVNGDLRSYVEATLEQKPDFVDKKLSPSLLEEIRDKIRDGADGMFRWETCQLESLARCLSPSAIETALESLPSDLNETYRRMVQNIPPEYKSSTIRLLQFLVYTKRPLTLPEAVEVIATEINQEPRGFNVKRRLFKAADILRYCPSLVIIAEVTNYDKTVEELHLAHFSVKEYLLKQAQFSLESASIVITRTCLTYLGDIKNNCSTTRSDFPMARYAAEYWTEYAVSAETSEEIVRTTVSFLRDETTFQRWCRLYQADCWWDHEPGPPRAPRLYYACLAGLAGAARDLTTERADVNAQGGWLGNALQAASYEGNLEVVQLLLGNGADVNAEGGRLGNALQAASINGNRGIVQLLLDNGAVVNAERGYYGNDLYAA